MPLCLRHSFRCCRFCCSTPGDPIDKKFKGVVDTTAEVKKHTLDPDYAHRAYATAKENQDDSPHMRMDKSNIHGPNARDTSNHIEGDIDPFSGKPVILSPSKKLLELGARSVGKVDCIDADANDLEWVNKMLSTLWPYVNTAIARMLRNDIAPMLNESLPAPLNTFSVKEFYLGEDAPRMGPISAYSKKKQGGTGFEVDIFISWKPDVNVVLQILGVKLGIKSLVIEGTLSVVLRPLLKEMPIVGGIQAFLINPPEIDFDFTGAANIIDMPMIAGRIRRIMNDAICDALVLPNRIFVPIASPDQVDMTKMQFPRPEAVIRVRLLRGNALTAKDFSVVGPGTSDPYVLMRMGTREYRTATIKKNLNPVWCNAVGDFFMFNKRQLLRISVFDEDAVSADDIIGVNISRIGDIALTEKNTLELTEDGEASGMLDVEISTLKLERIKSFDKLPMAFADYSHVGILQFEFGCARGIPKKFDRRGMQLEIHLSEGATESERKRRKHVKTSLDLLSNDQECEVRKSPWATVKPSSQHLDESVPVPMQAMIENIRLGTKMPEDLLAKYAQIDVELIREVLKKRPSYDTVFNYGCHFLVSDPKRAEVTVSLKTDAGKRLYAKGEFTIQELMDPRFLGLMHLKMIPPETKVGIVGGAVGKALTDVKELGKTVGHSLNKWITTPLQSKASRESKEEQRLLHEEAKEEKRLLKRIGSLEYKASAGEEAMWEGHSGRNLGRHSETRGLQGQGSPGETLSQSPGGYSTAQSASDPYSASPKAVNGNVNFLSPRGELPVAPEGRRGSTFKGIAMRQQAINRMMHLQQDVGDEAIVRNHDTSGSSRLLNIRKKGPEDEVSLEIKIHAFKLVHVSEYEELLDFYKDNEG